VEVQSLCQLGAASVTHKKWQLSVCQQMHPQVQGGSDLLDAVFDTLLWQEELDLVRLNGIYVFYIYDTVFP
jgi:hypothetical protein